MDKRAWWLISTIILISPITFWRGSSSLVFIFDIFCLILCLCTLTSKRNIVGERFVFSITVPFLLVGLFLFLQIVPISPTLLKLLEPETWQAYQETIWKLNPGVWMPISNHVEATIFAWFHIGVLWAFCLAFGLLIDSHWQLFRLVQIFVLAVIIWSCLIITASILEAVSSPVIHGNEFFIYHFKETLGLWVVVFCPLVYAGYVSCRPSRKHRSQPRKLVNFLKKPEIPPHCAMMWSLCLACFSLVLLLRPMLWFIIFTGYLLFLAFKPNRKETQPLVSPKIITFLAWFCVVAPILWITLFHKPASVRESFFVTNKTGWDFTWFGHGLGAHADVNNTITIAGWGQQTIVKSGVLAEIWTGLGGMGTFLVLFAMLTLYFGAGGRKSINKTDLMSANLSSGGLSGALLILTTGSFLSLWHWLATVTGLLFLVIFVTWCRRISHLMSSGVTHEVSRFTLLGLRASVSILLLSILLIIGLRSGAAFLVGSDDPMAADSASGFIEEGDEEWLVTLARLMPHDIYLSLVLGKRYLIQKRDKDAEPYILSALRMRPLSPQVHVAVASLSACAGDEETALHFFSTNVAKHYVPDNTTKLLAARLLGLSDSDAAIRLINLTLEHSPQQASLYLNLMTLYGYEPLTFKSLLPDQPFVMLALGDLLRSKNYTEEADKAYLAAALNPNKTLDRDETLYLRTARYFSDTNRLTQALVIVRAGREEYPRSESLKYLASELSAQRALEVDPTQN